MGAVCAWGGACDAPGTDHAVVAEDVTAAAAAQQCLGQVVEVGVAAVHLPEGGGSAGPAPSPPRTGRRPPCSAAVASGACEGLAATPRRMDPGLGVSAPAADRRCGSGWVAPFFASLHRPQPPRPSPSLSLSLSPSLSLSMPVPLSLPLSCSLARTPLCSPPVSLTDILPLSCHQVRAPSRPRGLSKG